MNSQIPWQLPLQPVGSKLVQAGYSGPPVGCTHVQLVARPSVILKTVEDMQWFTQALSPSSAHTVHTEQILSLISLSTYKSSTVTQGSNTKSICSTVFGKTLQMLTELGVIFRYVYSCRNPLYVLYHLKVKHYWQLNLNITYTNCYTNLYIWTALILWSTVFLKISKYYGTHLPTPFKSTPAQLSNATKVNIAQFMDY